MKEKNLEKKSGFTTFLQGVERIGNKMPDLTVMFFFALLALIAISCALSFVTFDYFHPTTGDRIEVINMLAPDKLIGLLTSLTNNFITFPALGITMVATLGIGLAEGSGFMKTGLVKLLGVMPKKAVVPCVALIAILCHIISDSAYVILMPVAALMFYSAGRHPLAGIAVSFAALAGGFSASLTPATIDPIMQGFTQSAAQIMDPTYTVNVLCNYFLSASSTVGVVLVCWLINDKIVEPFLWKTMPLDDDFIPENMDATAISAIDNKAFKIAGTVFLIMVIALAAALIPADSIWRSETGSLTSSTAPVMQAIVPLLFFFLAIPGIVFGVISGRFKTTRDVTLTMSNGLRNLLYFMVFAFVCAQFLYVFGLSNVGTLLAVSGAEFLKSMNMPSQVTVGGIILFTACLNLLITSASSKWAILAPIFVPMLMAVGISPELTQASFRISDSAINIITPMFAFYPLIISYCQKYCKKTGVGTLSSMMLPYSLGLLLVLGTMLYVFWALGIPLGFDSGYVYPAV